MRGEICSVLLPQYAPVRIIIKPDNYPAIADRVIGVHSPRPGENFFEPNIELAPTAMNFPNHAVGVEMQPGKPDFIQSRLNKIG
ncbi:MAG: hypothetical protein HF973_04645 [Chloroflexi bacterium]|nr:hypothetical protein [Chloroflexota bacterium]